MLSQCPNCGLPYHHFSSETGGEDCPHCTQKTVTTVDEPGVQETLHAWWELLIRPKRFYARSPYKDPVTSRTLLWASLATGLGLVMMLIWTIGIERTRMGAAPMVPLQTLWVLVLIPFWIPVSIFFRALWLTCGLWLVGLFSRTRWKTTFNLSGHSHVSSFWMVVPIIGPVIAEISRVVVLVTGSARMYHISRGRALLAMISPLILFTIVAAAALALVALVVALVIGGTLSLSMLSPGVLSP